MKLEEALPLYRAGKTIVSNVGGVFSLGHNNKNTYYLSSAHEEELMGEWTVKEEPIKYSVDVWTQCSPSANKSIHIGTYILGDYGSWSSIKGEGCTRHLRITVEEVGDEKV